MDNYAIADNFSLLSKLIDIHGDDSFKAKSYSSAAFAIEKLPAQLAEMPAEKMFAVKGIGQAIGKKILEQFETGRLQVLDEYILKTPPGILEMLKIKGLGPKKISTIWKELCVENLGELLYACEENRLLLYKGFGAKTQQNIKDSIEYYFSNRGRYLFSQIEQYADEIHRILVNEFESYTLLQTGCIRMHSLVIDSLQWVTNTSPSELSDYFTSKDYEVERTENSVIAKGPENVKLEFYSTETELLYNRLFKTSCSESFLINWEKTFAPWDDARVYASEEDIFNDVSIDFIPAYLRELPVFIERAVSKSIPAVLQLEDIRGIIHSHSDWSDGVDTLEAMVKGCIEKNYEYLVISDHSQSAFYANGLYPDRIKAQHKLIDELNKKYAPFKIFKSIESDILNDGSLDYTNDILETFDLVITSIHSNFKMSEEKATARIIKAISNPYATIMGHMTGRLLLSRNGYPVDHKQVIDACVEHNVVIEVNAHPRRLDMDYQYLPYAIERGVTISIDPDAHAVSAFDDVKFGVLAAQKGGLTKEQNLSSFSLQQMEAFLEKQRQKRLSR